MTYSEAIQQILSDLDTAESRLKIMLSHAGELSAPELHKAIGAIGILRRFMHAAERFMLHENLLDEEISE